MRTGSLRRETQPLSSILESHSVFLKNHIVSSFTFPLTVVTDFLSTDNMQEKDLRSVIFATIDSSRWISPGCSMQEKIRSLQRFGISAMRRRFIKWEKGWR